MNELELGPFMGIQMFHETMWRWLLAQTAVPRPSEVVAKMATVKLPPRIEEPAPKMLEAIEKGFNGERQRILSMFEMT